MKTFDKMIDKPNTEWIKNDREEVSKLTDDEILYEQLEYQKSIKGYETQCAICNGRSYNPYIRYHEDGVGTIDERDCVCKGKGQSAVKLENAHIPIEQSLQTFHVVHQYQQHMMSSARDSIKRDTSFIALGQNGSGKTHICTGIIIEEVNNGKDVKYFDWVKDAQSYTYNVSQSKMEELLEVDILYIDDLFKASKRNHPSEAELKLYYTIVNGRYRYNKKPIIVSSEHSLEKLREFDKGTTDRLVEMCKGNVVEIGEDEERNYRAKHI